MGNKFHFHDQLEVLLTMSEGGHFFIQNVIYDITRGGLFILTPDDLHRSAPCSTALYQFYSVRFYPEEVRGFSGESFDLLSCFYHHGPGHSQVQLQGDQLDHLLKIINKMEYYLSNDCSAYGKEVYAKTQLAEALVYVNYLYNTPSNTSAHDDKEFENMLPVVNYIKSHISEELTLDVLCQQTFMNKYYLSKRFKQIVGISISDYIIRTRLAAARSFLRQGMSVTMAGEKSGFNSSAHFIRTFMKHVGITPRRYAQQFKTLEKYKPLNNAREDFHLS